MLPGRGGPVEWSIDGEAIRFDVDVAVGLRPAAARVGRARARAASPTAVGSMTGLSVRAVDVTVTGLDRTEAERLSRREERRAAAFLLYQRDLLDGPFDAAVRRLRAGQRRSR